MKPITLADALPRDRVRTTELVCCRAWIQSQYWMQYSHTQGQWAKDAETIHIDE
jgi:hypothetical protein